MGDRYSWNQPCPMCGKDMDVWYAESCGITTVKCFQCGAEFDIVMDLKLIKRDSAASEAAGKEKT